MTGHLVLIALLLLAFCYWYQGQKVKEIAYQATQAYCQSVEVQMLDGYVAGHGLWLRRGADGKMHLERTFAFEFASTGERRYNGKIIMLGDRVERIVMEPYRVDLG